MTSVQHLSILCLGQSGMKTLGKFVINLLDVYPALPGLKRVFNITPPKLWHLHFERPSVVAAPQRASRWWRRCGQPPSKSCHTSCGTPTNHLRFVFVNITGHEEFERKELLMRQFMPLKCWLNTTRLIKIIGTMLLWHDWNANPWNILIISRIPHHFYQTGSRNRGQDIVGLGKLLSAWSAKRGAPKAITASGVRDQPSAWRTKIAKPLNLSVGGSICQTIYNIYRLTRSCLNMFKPCLTWFDSSGIFLLHSLIRRRRIQTWWKSNKTQMSSQGGISKRAKRAHSTVTLPYYRASAKVAARIANDAPKLWPVKTSFQ